MTQVLYLKWRPGDWNEVIGQDHIITTLKNAVRQDRVSHAQLFSGPRGTGKTSTARLLAKAVNCLADNLEERPCNQCAHCLSINQGEFLDLIEIDAASNTSVDDVRDLREKINFSPNQGRYKVYIIDEVHMLSKPAFNALLKTLEEPPPHAMFVLATTEVHKIPITVISRCQRHDFRRISVSEIIEQLKTLAAAESIKVDEDVLGLIARQATGSLRDAISILDQLSSAEGQITQDLAHQVLGTSPDQAVLNFVDALLKSDTQEGLNTLHESAERGNDPIQFTRQVIAYLRNVLLLKMGSSDRIDVPSDVLAVIKVHGGAIEIRQLLDLIRIFNNAVNDRGGSWQPILPLEIAFLEAMETNSSLSVSLSKADDKAPLKKNKQNKSEEKPASSQKKKIKNQQNDPPEVAPRGEKPYLESQQWKDILDRVRDVNPATQGILNSCRPLGFKDDHLVLCFRSDAIRGKMEKGDHLEICQEVIEKVLGIKVPLVCIVGDKDQADLPDGVDPDGLVATAMRDLGGSYISNQENEI